MKKLKTLVAMQLKDKLNLSFLKSKKQTIFKVVLSLLKFVIITAMIYVGFSILSSLRLVSILPGIPQNFFVLVFSIMFILSVIVCTFGLIKNLYFAKDNQVLLTLPASKTTIFSSKLIVFYIYEIIRNTTYMLPLFVAYGLINALPFYFYFWLLVSFLLVTALPVVLGALLSIPMMFISSFVKHQRWLEYILITAFISATIVGIIVIINAIPSNFDLIGTWGTTFWKIQSFLENFNKIFIPLVWVANSIIGERYGVSNNLFNKTQILSVLGVIGIIVLVLTITYLIVKPLFFKMASTPFEYKKKKVLKHIQNSKHSSFVSSLKKECITIFRMSEKIYGLLFVVIGLPISIFLLNKIYAAMDTRLAGGFMTIAFNILMILLISLASNTSMAHAISEEGASSYLIKTTPNSYIKNLLSKSFINFISMSLSILTSVIIFSIFAKFSVWSTFLIFIALQAIYISHLLYSLELDIMNPQDVHYQTTGTHVNNPNDIKSVLSSFLISAIFAFLTYFFIAENQYYIWYRILFIALLFLIYRVWSYINKIKVYYKER